MGCPSSLHDLISSEECKIRCFSVHFPFLEQLFILALAGADFEDCIFFFSLLVTRLAFIARCSALMGSKLGKNVSPLVHSLISYDMLLSAFLKCDMEN